MNETDLLIRKMTDFISKEGISVHFEPISGDTVLPGLLLRKGELVIDRERLLYPGDILHEAGHLAVMPPSVRKTMDDRLGSEGFQQAGEIMAFAWSYAACVHLGIDPFVVFHNNGYQGNGEHVAREFMQGHYVGVPLMEWLGMTNTEMMAESRGEPAFPLMKQWVCTTEP